ncbi:hypothetical protein [Agriterribacter humi]|uniref:hypothetical protein n=1 Tax=Agriterribacter humi TaxID=1104781 RepID=UPI0012648E2D|nr:hypothetical protein [Agriterribacter humi]
MDEYFIKPEFFESDSIKKFYEYKVDGKLRGMNVKANGKTYKVYVRELFEILSNKEIPCYQGLLNGFPLIEDYAKGFNKGVSYFNNEYAAKPDTIYSNKEDYINNLHLCFFHKAPEQNKGWIHWINSYPFIITNKVIEEYGYYAGINNSLERLKEKHSVLFKDFEIHPESKPTKSMPSDKNNNELRLSDLFEDNSFYERLISEFEKKLATTAVFISEIEFINSERDRINHLYLNPIEVKLLDDGAAKMGPQFKFDEYRRYAFDWLMQGDNRILRNILAAAQRNYLVLFQLNDVPPDFDQSIVTHLKAGVAYVAYYKFLSQKLDELSTNNNSKIKHKLNTLKDIFSNTESKISVIKEAIKDLNITKDLSERAITGFINGCKEADALPQINDTDLLRIVFNEIGKTYGKTNKPRYDKDTYSRFLKDTKRYFGIK